MYVALSVFCKIIAMTRLNATRLSSHHKTQPFAEAAEWIEICFPKVEDLLRRLAREQAQKRRPRRFVLFGSRTVTMIAVFAVICIPGCAAATILLMTAGSRDLRPAAKHQQRLVTKVDFYKPAPAKPVPPKPPLPKSDRLSPAQPAAGAAETSPALAQTIYKTVLPWGVALRGSVAGVPVTTSTAGLSAVLQPTPAPSTSQTISQAMPVKAATEMANAAP